MISAYMLQRYTPNCYYKKNAQFTLEQAMKTQRSVQRYSSTLSLTSPVDGGGDGWLTPLASRFAPGENNPYLL
jgi:hypothetical protein